MSSTSVSVVTPVSFNDVAAHGAEQYARDGFIVVPGLAYGSQLALGALGITLIFSVLRFSNFAHGDTMAFGTAFVILFTWWFQSMGITAGPLPTALLALPLGILVTIAMVLATDRVVYRFYRKQRAKPIIVVIVSTGVMFVMNGLVRMIIGTSEQNFSDGARMMLNPQDFKAATGLVEPLAIKTTHCLLYTSPSPRDRTTSRMPSSP